jgi:hypothetical protein
MKRTTRVITAIGVLLVAASAFLVVRDGAENASLVAAADRLHPEPSWRLQNEVVGPSTICITTCGTLSRRWITDTEFTPATLKELGSKAGWDLEVQGDCRYNPATSGSTLCSARGISNGYSIVLWVLALEADQGQGLSLEVDKIPS